MKIQVNQELSTPINRQSPASKSEKVTQKIATDEFFDHMGSSTFGEQKPRRECII